MIKTTNLTNHFLLASPSLDDIHFARSVVYIHQHNSQGSMGLIVNKPLNLKFADLLQKLEIASTELSQPVSENAVLMGGPMGQENGFLLFNLDTNNPSVEMSSSKEMLHQVALNQGPRDFIMALGYCSWEAGQLEQEIIHNDWIICPFDQQLLFQTPAEQLWLMAMRHVGIDDIGSLSCENGHA